MDKLKRGGGKNSFKAKKDMDLKGDAGTIEKGTIITGTATIASGNGIKDIKRLIRDYPMQNGEKTKAEDWKKMRGTARIKTKDGLLKIAEVHYYQGKNIGKIEFKVKRWIV